MSRREFLARSTTATIAGATALAVSKPGLAAATPSAGTIGSLIDLTACEGCGACVTACSVKNAGNHPVPVDDIPVNWPTGKSEDWSDLADDTGRLTPYNWTYVEHLEVDGHALNIPRRCMHCDDPACAKLCPFGAQDKDAQGAVVIDHHLCMGGAKCRDVCPWEIPQRQAGVGLYMNLLPGLVGGGVMYKCDMCADMLEQGEQPACATACPTGAMRFGDKEEMRLAAAARAEEIGGYVYGVAENGGTSTFYVSPVPFERIDEAIVAKKADLPQRLQTSVPRMAPDVRNYLDTATGLTATYAAAPIAGVAAA
ncbi:MAG: 4Fe-4S dicluster domain-containing protein, partial [Actinomycetota bacterium]|nr:4Fe-4S dicluster domain-containing protein [Actinomycetota bacterium]